MDKFLLDVNILIALIDAAHVFHESAHQWLSSHPSDSWVTCPITENGFARVLSNPAYPNIDLSPSEAISLLQRAKDNSANHCFWPDDISITDSTIFSRPSIQGHKQITDSYLIALAERNDGYLLTADKRITDSAIKSNRKRVKYLVSV